MTEGTESRAEGQLVGGGKYRVEAVLGTGAMGAVYRVRQLSLNRTVALKLLKREAVSGLANLKRFVQEARLLTRLSHPNVVPVYDVDLEGEEPYIAMELVEGPSLESVLEEPGRTARPDPLAVARDLASGLAYVHGQGVLHRDIKPANILLKEGSRAMLADFGLARGADSASLTTAGFVVGTPAYLAPEQFTQGVSNERTDIYQLGLVLYEVITGKLLIQAGGPEMQKVLAARMEGRTPDLLKIAPECPRELARAVMRCLAKDPALRFQSAQELVDALAQVPTGSSDQVPMSRTAMTAAKSPARREGAGRVSARQVHKPEIQQEKAQAKRWVLASLGVCILIGAGAVLATRQDSPATVSEQVGEKTTSAPPDVNIDVTEWSYEPTTQRLRARARLSRPVVAGWRIGSEASNTPSGSAATWADAEFAYRPNQPFKLIIERSDEGPELVITEADLLRALRSEGERLTRTLRDFWSRTGLTDQSFVNALLSEIGKQPVRPVDRQSTALRLEYLLEKQLRLLKPVQQFTRLALLFFETAAIPVSERAALFRQLAPLQLADKISILHGLRSPFGTSLSSIFGRSFRQEDRPDGSQMRNFLVYPLVGGSLLGRKFCFRIPSLAHSATGLIGAQFRLDMPAVLKVVVADLPLYFALAKPPSRATPYRLPSASSTVVDKVTPAQGNEGNCERVIDVRPELRLEAQGAYGTPHITVSISGHYFPLHLLKPGIHPIEVSRVLLGQTSLLDEERVDLIWLGIDTSD